MTDQEKRNEDIMHKNPNNWQGVFYVHRKDHRIIVPKANPVLGWTLNFGNPYTYVMIAIVILILVGFSLFL